MMKLPLPAFSLVAGCLLVLCLLAGVARAVSPVEPNVSSFQQGNLRYGAGQYPEAVAAYEMAVQRGDVNANLFYNLANAYYRAGDRGRAILNYQRALLLEPGHAEASANLAFVRGRPATDGGHPPGTLATVRDALAGPGVDFYCWLAAGAGWLAALGLLAACFRPRRRAAGVAFAAAGVLGVVLCAGVVSWLDGGLKSPRRAVIIADGAPALYSPADNAKTIVRLPVGSEVRVLSAQGAWMYVQLGDGARGWLASDKVARVNPKAG